MNKHAQSLQTMLALLPPEVCHVYRDTIHDAVIELDRLDNLANNQHAELFEILQIIQCPAESPTPSMEQTLLVRGVASLAQRVTSAGVAT